MEYVILKNQTVQAGHYSLVPIRESDMMMIMKWRNSQIDILRQKTKLTKENQRRYWLESVCPSFRDKNPKLILFSFLLDKICVGYGGLSNIEWTCRRAELSFLMETNRIRDTYQYEKDFSAFLLLVKQIAFGDIGFNRLFTETYDIRPHHVLVLEKNGFILEGRLREHVYIGGKYADSLIHGLLRRDYHA